MYVRVQCRAGGAALPKGEEFHMFGYVKNESKYVRVKLSASSTIQLILPLYSLIIITEITQLRRFRTSAHHG